MVKTLILHGYLAELIPDGLKIDCDTVYEALQFLANHPLIKARGNGPGSLPVVATGFNTVSSLKNPTKETEIHIHPTDLVEGGLSGAGGGRKGSFLQIVIGVILIVTAFFVPGGPTGALGSYMINAGIGMIIGGTLGLLLYQKPPDPEDRVGDSRYVPSRGNTTRVGTPIPLAYGRRVRLDGHVISLNVDVAQIMEWRDEPVVTIEPEPDVVTIDYQYEPDGPGDGGPSY